MIEITAAAGEQLRALQAADPARSFPRVYVAGKGCCSYRYGIAFDEKTDEADQVAESEGIRIAMDPESSPLCEGATTDFVSSAQGMGFVVRGQKTEGGCTCGRS
jgi:iron-sulfur cluster assembly accessory protein